MLKVEATYDKAVDAWDISFHTQWKGDWDKAKEIIAILKATIPAADRTYDPKTKHWSILAKYYEPIKTAYKPTTNWVETTPTESEQFFYEEALNAPIIVTKESIAAQLCTMLQISSDVLRDTNAAKKAYRMKALQLHPDRNNGDGSKMSELNSLWSAYNAS